MSDSTILAYRAWSYGPNGEAQIFTDPAHVPEGWRDHPFAQASFDKASFDKAQDRPRKGRLAK